jgi:hypothetical protein
MAVRATPVPLRPATRLTLFDVYGEGAVYVRRPAPSAARWLPKEPGVLDFLSGGQTAIAGPMPVVAAAATATPEVLRLLASTGLPLSPDVRTYRTVPEYLALLRALGARGLRLALQTQHAASEVDPAHCVVDPEVARDLNDKGRLAELVPAALVPPRRVLPPALVPRGADLVSGGRPVVLKAANRQASGAGVSVRVCRTAAEADAARAEMAEEPGVVVEEWLDLERSACVHAVVRRDGTVEPLGVAEQVCDDRGGYHGNRLDAEADALVPPGLLEAVLGVVARGAAHGYRGFAGVDVAFPRGGPPVVLDLNFRMNGSTPAALLRASLEADGPRAVRSRTLVGDGGFPDLLATVRAGTERGTLVPLALYDPRESPEGGRPRAAVLLVGRSRAEVEDEERRLASLGLR